MKIIFSLILIGALLGCVSPSQDYPKSFPAGASDVVVVPLQDLQQIAEIASNNATVCLNFAKKIQSDQLSPQEAMNAFQRDSAAWRSLVSGISMIISGNK